MYSIKDDPLGWISFREVWDRTLMVSFNLSHLTDRVKDIIAHPEKY